MTAPTPAASSAAPRRPLFERLARYAAVFHAAWARRDELAGPRRLVEEVAFLPAALSLQESPVHPAPRRAMLAIVLLFVLALAWSWFGQVDVVAVASGRIVVSDRSKIVQPLDAGVIKAIHVRDGDKVRAGQVLIELDTTSATADRRSVEEQAAEARSEVQRSRGLLAALSGRPFAPAMGDVRQHAEWQDVGARLARVDAEIARRKAELVTVEQLVAKLQATLPLASQREADFMALAEQGFVAGHAGQDRLRERIELERDLATQQARLAEARAALAESILGKGAYLADLQRTLNDRLAKAELDVRQLEQQNAKTHQREQLMRLLAPVTGTVQQLAVHTAGGVVTPAQPLMVIVPDGAEVVAEVLLENKDIGFVHAGQAGEIKIDTFPFTRYGTVPATVQHVTPDAVADDRQRAMFPVRLVLGHNHLQVDGRRLPLTPGMTVAAEIKTGRRRVLDFLLSPIQGTLKESLRER